MGSLKISGTLDPNQFFPTGESDGDTAHVLVDKNGFSYSNDGKNFKVTHVFDNAHVVGQGSKNVLDSQGRITIRFQGIDAPELHFRPVFKNLSTSQKNAVKAVNHDFRQPLGETAGTELGKFVQSLSQGVAPVKCTVVTEVDHPNDVCDTYGRVVADILVRQNNKDVDLNEWMAQNGWALPAFYNSMSRSEITTFQNLAAQAKNSQLGIWPFMDNTIDFPDPNVTYQKGKQHPPDTGTVIFPKYFRRSCNWYVSVEAGLTANLDFSDFLAAQKTSDKCYLTSDFLNGPSSAHLHLLTDFVRHDGLVTQAPDALVFKEATSTLFDASGKKITSF